MREETWDDVILDTLIISIQGYAHGQMSPYDAKPMAERILRSDEFKRAFQQAMRDGMAREFKIAGIKADL